MSHNPSRSVLGAAVALLAGAVLAACGGSATPQLIGAYRPESSPPIATYVPAPPNSVVTYDGFLDLEVRNVTAAADAAAELAYAYGGYPSSSQSWYDGRNLHATLTLAVPTAQFEALRRAVLDLGQVVEERLNADIVTLPPGHSAWNTYASLTIHFAPATVPAVRLPPLPSLGWSPARTFASAFGLFAALFTFLVDVIIWISVVAGPFVLLGLGLRWLARRLRRPESPDEKS
jgi:hypothetical protein